jgi:hypothetical protein
VPRNNSMSKHYNKAQPSRVKAARGGMISEVRQHNRNTMISPSQGQHHPTRPRYVESRSAFGTKKGSAGCL